MKLRRRMELEIFGPNHRLWRFNLICLHTWQCVLGVLWVTGAMG